MNKRIRVARALVALVLAITMTGLSGSVVRADGNVEQRIADFWARVNALQPTDFLSAGDLGGWALNVIERNPRARTTVLDFRASTAGMQAALDRAGLAPVAVTPTPAPTPTPPPSAGVPGGVPNAVGAVPPSFARFGGTVVDALTGLPIKGVCVYSGPPAGCPLQGTPRTDSTGFFAIDYPAGITFLWTFEHPDYLGLLSQPIAGGTTPTFKLTHK